MTVKCESCGKDFKNEHGLHIHLALEKRGKVGGKKRRAKAGKARGRKGKGRKAFKCVTCGRSFALAMHLARHRTASHGAAKAARPAKAGRRPGRPRKAAAVSGIDVKSLSVDQLLAVKAEVDAKLGDIVAQMRRARVNV